MSSPVKPRSSANPTRQQLDDLDDLLQRMLELPVNQLEEGEAAPETATATAEAAPLDQAETPGEEEPLPAPTPPASARPSRREAASRQWRADAPRPGAEPMLPTSSFPPPAPEVKQPAGGQAPPESPFLPHAPGDTMPAVALPPGDAWMTPFAERREATPNVPPVTMIPMATPVLTPALQPNTPAMVSIASTAPPVSRSPRLATPPPRRHARVERTASVEPVLPLGLRALVQVNLLYDEVTARLGPPGRWARRPWGRNILGWTGLLLLGSVLALLALDWIGWTR